MIEKFEGDHITDTLITAAAEFFTLNYGVWGPLAANKIGVKEGTPRISSRLMVRKSLSCSETLLTPESVGARVRMSSRILKEKILPPDAVNIYVRMLGNDGKLIGNAFATRWTYDNRLMLWVTQLCVSKHHRNQGIAKKLLQELRHDSDYGVGILSSHPFAISAVLRVFGSGLEKTDLEVIRQQAQAVMKSCPVEYVSGAGLRGTLFEKSETLDNVISCADTKFWVDHKEPLTALDIIKEKGAIWPFGNLPEGHEFLALVSRSGHVL